MPVIHPPPFLEIQAATLVSCLGGGLQAHRQALLDQKSGLQLCQFETVEIETYVGKIDQLDQVDLPNHLRHYDCRNNRLAELCLQQDGFFDQVLEAKARFGAARVGVFLGTSTSGILQTELAYRERFENFSQSTKLPDWFEYPHTHNTYSVSAYVRERLALSGPAWVVSSACSSGAKAFANAQRMIRCGLIDAALVGGVDTLCLTTLYGFASLELTSQKPCTPFGHHRDGISIAEAAGFALLTKFDSQSSSAVPSNAVLMGAGESSDAHHMSSPHPAGLGAKAAMQAALLSAGLEPYEIDYVNLHGTATPSNDAAEDLAMQSLLPKTPCSSTKAATGHTLGAAGAIEAILSILSLELGVIIGGVGTQKIDPQLRSNYILQNINQPLTYVMSNSFGFGGSNASLIFTQVKHLLERKQGGR